MKSRNIFALSIALAALVIIAFAAFIPATSASGKKELTACEKENLKYAPQIKAFNRAFNSAAIFKALPTLQDIQRSESIKLARLKYGQLDPEKRRAVWKAKFSQVDVEDFNPGQKVYFERVQGVVDSAKFDGTDDAQTGKALFTEGRDLFTKSQFFDLFMSLKANAGIMKAKAAGAAQIPECECNWSTPGGMDDFCKWSHGTGWWCWSTTPCVRHIGCGYLWMAWCDGFCRNP